MSETRERDFIKHWPTIVLGLVVAAIFITALFSFQVKSTETAVVTTFGKIGDSSVKEPGLHFRWPYPIQNVFKFDARLRAFDGNVGRLEEVYTRDGKNLIVGVYVLYRIGDPARFYQNVVDIPTAEDRLNTIMRTVKNSVFGRYDFDQIVNTDPAKMRVANIEEEILEGVKRVAEAEYGLAIVAAGVKSVGVPEQITQKVFDRMTEERKVIAQKYRSQGESRAATIRYEADNRRSQIVSEAEAMAIRLRAEGDAEAASYYAVYRENPELAIFLRKLDSLRKIMGTRTTLVLDTDSAPFDLLKMNPEQAGGTAAAQ